ncbi:hypothetical protein K376_00913 [Streptomyces sp. PsTaAH-130]|nr:hypothetical protein K376_00913 [Streptomyces sp. PsTaAH-130]
MTRREDVQEPVRRQGGQRRVGADRVRYDGGHPVYLGNAADGGVPDPDAGHIGDRVERPGGELPDDDAQITRPGTGRPRRLLLDGRSGRGGGTSVTAAPAA